MEGHFGRSTLRLTWWYHDAHTGGFRADGGHLGEEERDGW